MERFTISKSEKQTIYEIYKACRLCGAGGGYRMPIIQNIIDLDSTEVELQKKIQECLQLEVRPDDRMPPLICELCVDKLNDFYQFLELTRQTNVKTRTRLGLPIQDTRKGDPEQSNCILGVTEPVYSEDSDSQKKNKAGPKCKKIKKEPEVNVKTEAPSDSSRSSSVSSRAGRASRRSSPPRSRRSLPADGPTRGNTEVKEAGKMDAKQKTAFKDKEAVKNKEHTMTTKEKKATPGKKKGELESLLEDSVKYEDNSLLMPRSLKRTREEPPRPALLPKRAKPIPTRELLKEPSPPRRPGPKSKQPLKEPSPPPRPGPKSKQLVKEPSPPRRPGPKSKQLVKEPSPPRRPGPKSKQPLKEPSPPRRPGPKSKQLVKEPSPPRRPGPKSKQPVKESSPPRSMPGPKSKKARLDEENIPVPLKVPKSKAKPEMPKTKEPLKPPEEPSVPSGPPYICAVCAAECKNGGSFARHLSVHTPTYTKPANACNPCGKWFVTTDEAADHHRYHGATTFPYHCRRCFDDFRTLLLYDEHIKKGLCTKDEQPSVKCEECLATFATEALRLGHKCPSRAQTTKPGVKCSKCLRTYATAKSLKKHESQCGLKRKGGDLIADPDVLRRLKPMQVRITKCDGLLDQKGDHYDVSRVKPNYGLAKKYIYPYMKLPPVKNEPLYRDSMVAIPAALKEEFSFTHWDSDSDVEESIIKSVPSLSTLAIKKLFSKSLIGKVPRKRKKVKYEAFDNEDFGDMSKDINDIISSLDDKGNGRLDRKDLTAKIKDIIGCFDDSDVSESVDGATVNESQSENLNAKESDVTTPDNRDEIGKIHLNAVDVKENVETNVDEREDKDTVSDKDSSKIDLENNDSTKENVETNDDSNKESINVNVNVNEESKDKVLESSELDISNVSEAINRLDNETENQSDNYSNEIETSLQMLNEDNGSLDTREPEDILFNGINNHNENFEDNSKSDHANFEDNSKSDHANFEDNSKNDHANFEDNSKSDHANFEDNSKNDHANFEDNSKSDHANFEDNSKSDHANFEDYFNSEQNDVNELNKPEEINKQINKESPIKHSIDNLIGDTDKNADKYINEVISSIENIIMNNPRNDEEINGRNENEINDINVDALDIGGKRTSDHDKITLEDLLPKENRHEELENISDDDFDFDA